MSRAACLSVLMLLAACGKSADRAADGNATDPAITTALADPLMTDPGLDRRSNGDALQPPDEPYRAIAPPGEPDPLREGAAPTVAARATELIARHAAAAFAGCGQGLRYSAIWAAALPPEVALPDGGRVAEAAGSDAGGCHYRVVGYAVAMPVGDVVKGVRSAGQRAGYVLTDAARGKAQVVIGKRGRDGAAFIIAVDAGRGDDTLVDVVTNRGT